MQCMNTILFATGGFGGFEHEKPIAIKYIIDQNHVLS